MLEPMPWSVAKLATLDQAGGSKWRCRLVDDDLILIVIDAGQNIHAVHDPTFCFRGAGYQIVNQSDVLLPGGRENKSS